MNNKENITRCGTVAIVGAPNAGKSTLLNRMIGSKVAIVTPKVQTTRSRILGILTKDASQLIFIDTPGIFQAKHTFEKAMVHAAYEGAKEADIVLMMVDARRGVDDDTKRIVEHLSSMKGEKILVLNKIDDTPKAKLPPLAQALFGQSEFTHCFMVSAVTGDGVLDIVNYLTHTVPEGPFLYPEDQVTDVPMRQLAAEITREKLFITLRQEVPYSLMVETEAWEEKEKKGITIRQVIVVETEGQKKIVIGKGGAVLKKIGEQSRKELTRLLGKTVHLFLFVKVSEGWKEKSVI